MFKVAEWNVAISQIVFVYLPWWQKAVLKASK